MNTTIVILLPFLILFVYSMVSGEGKFDNFVSLKDQLAEIDRDEERLLKELVTQYSHNPNYVKHQTQVIKKYSVGMKESARKSVAGYPLLGSIVMIVPALLGALIYIIILGAVKHFIFPEMARICLGGVGVMECWRNMEIGISILKGGFIGLYSILFLFGSPIYGIGFATGMILCNFYILPLIPY